MLEYLILKHSRHPKGFLGKFFSRIFDNSNAYQNQITMRLLDFAKTDEVLELGFGSGLLMTDASLFLEEGCITGLEHSQTMIKHVQKNYANLIESERLKLIHGDFNQLPPDLGQYNKILSSNTIYFINDLKHTFSEIHKHLKDNGTFILTFREQELKPGQARTKHGYTHHKHQDVFEILQTCGFSDVKFNLEEQQASEMRWNLVWFFCKQ